MSALHIRPFQSTDEEAVIALWQACGLVVPQNNPRRDIARKLRVNPEWFLVSELDGEIGGTCLSRACSSGPAAYLWNRTCCIRESTEAGYRVMPIQHLA